MGTGFDCVSAFAHSDARDLTPAVALRRKTLRSTMGRTGFQPIRSEWWHFDAAAKRYDAENVPI